MAPIVAPARALLLGLALLFASGCAATGDEAVAGESATRPAESAAAAADRRVGDPAVLGDLVVTVVEASRTERGARATFTIENRGPAPAVVSPGNFRLRTNGARPRMRLSGTPAPLPVGTLQTGDSLRGEVTWELPEGAALGVAFVNGAASAEWSPIQSIAEVSTTDG